MNAKAKFNKNQVNQVNIFMQDEIAKQAELIGHGLKAHSWKDNSYEWRSKLTIVLKLKCRQGGNFYEKGNCCCTLFCLSLNR